MSRRLSHLHRCDRCLTPVRCTLALSDNYDGWPPVVCEDYERRKEAWLCESCRADGPDEPK